MGRRDLHRLCDGNELPLGSALNQQLYIGGHHLDFRSIGVSLVQSLATRTRLLR